MELPKTYNTYFVAIIATVGGMLFGFDISSMSAIIGTDQVRIHTSHAYKAETRNSKLFSPTRRPSS